MVSFDIGPLLISLAGAAFCALCSVIILMVRWAVSKVERKLTQQDQVMEKITDLLTREVAALRELISNITTRVAVLEEWKRGRDWPHKHPEGEG